MPHWSLEKTLTNIRKKINCNFAVLKIIFTQVQSSIFKYLHAEKIYEPRPKLFLHVENSSDSTNPINSFGFGDTNASLVI